MDSAHNMFDGTLTEYNDSNDDAIEMRDAIKLGNSQYNFGLFRENGNYAVERRKTVDTIFFRIWGNKLSANTMSYALEINSIGLPQGRLEDKYLNTATAFGDGLTYYPFKVDAAQSDSYRPDRFRIIFSTPSSSKNIETKVTVYPNPSTKWINYQIDGKTGLYKVSFYNDLGVVVYAKKVTVLDSSFSQRVYLTGNSKFYTLKVIGQDSTATSIKILIK